MFVSYGIVDAARSPAAAALATRYDNLSGTLGPVITRYFVFEKRGSISFDSVDSDTEMKLGRFVAAAL